MITFAKGLYPDQGYSRKKYLGGEDGRQYIFLWVVGAESFQIIWVKKKKNFCGFSMGSNQYWAGRVYDFVFIIWRELPKAQPKVVLWRSRESNLRPLVYKA